MNPSGLSPAGQDSTASDARLLNVGCGRRIHHAWVNIDVEPQASGVIRHDVRTPLPFPEARFDVVYHSHVLEHLAPCEGARFLQECRRVLAPRGIVRIVVPDLEGIASAYLESLRAARQGVSGAAERHEWMVLELTDQAARDHSGGAVPEFLRTTTEAGRRFAIERWGAETQALLAPTAAPAVSPLKRVLSVARARWRASASSILGETWRVGRFRLSGEVHRWMYDAFSLGNALRRAGFEDVRSVSAGESWIPGWPDFRLDADAEGNPHKPDSLYMEARACDTPRG